MTNSMDKIQIRYAAPYLAPDSTEEEEQKYWDDFNNDVHKECNILDFFKIPPEELSPTDRKLQHNLRVIYKLNGSKSSLFHSCENKEGKSVLIDNTMSDDHAADSAACYEPGSHSVIIREIGPETPDATYASVIAHELKHATLSDEIDNLFAKANNYQKQQLCFLDEASAYTCQAIVRHKLDPTYTPKFNPPLDPSFWKQSPVHIKYELFSRYLKTLPFEDLYKLEYDANYPIDPKDKGLHEVPKSLTFGLPDTQVFILEMNGWYTPKGPTTLASYLQYFCINKQYDKAVELIKERPHLLTGNLPPVIMDLMKDNNLEATSKFLDLLNEKKDISIRMGMWLKFARQFRTSIPPEEQKKWAPMLQLFVEKTDEKSAVFAQVTTFMQRQKALKNDLLVDTIQTAQNARQKAPVKNKQKGPPKSSPSKKER